MVGDDGLEKLDRTAQEAVQPTVVLTATEGRQHDDEPVESKSAAGTTTSTLAPQATGNSTAAEPISAESPSAASGFASALPGYRKRVAVGLILFCLFAWGLSAFQKHAAVESKFRKWMDEAQSIDLKNGDRYGDRYGAEPEKLNNPYWKQALSVAIQLGENKKVLADLNVRAAGAELPGEAGRENRRVDLENAVSLYGQIPNTDSQRIKAINWLVSAIVPQFCSIQAKQGYTPPLFEDEVYGTPMDQCSTIDAAISHRQLPKALTLCRPYLAKSHHSNGLARALKIIASQLKVNDPLIPEAIPVFEDCVYYGSENIDELKDERLALEDVLTKGGFKTDSYAQLLKLARSVLATNDYHGAFIYLQRCLGDHQDAGLKEELLRVRQSIAKDDYKITNADLCECIDLLKTLRLVEIKDFGETSIHVLITDRQLCYLNALLGNYSEALRLLEWHVAKSSSRDNVDDLIYDMVAIYSAKGDCDSAIELLRERIGYRRDTPTWNDVISVVNQSTLYFQSGRYEKACQWLKSAHKMAANPQQLPWTHLRR